MPGSVFRISPETDCTEVNVEWLNQWQPEASTLAQGALRVLVVLLVWWILTRIVRLALNRTEARLLRDASADRPLAVEDRKRVETLVRLLRQVVNVFLFVTLALVMLMQLGIAVGPILASAGVVGIAVGFGAQSLVRDIITGFFFVIENQVRVGDVVTVNGTGGLVEAMTLRTLVLRDLSGVVHVFPNGSVNTLSNATRGWSAYVFDLRVGYREDADAAVSVIRQTAETLRADPHFGPKIIDAPEIFGVDRLDESAMIIRGRIKTHPIMQWEVGREFLKRAKQALQHAGMPPPYPHRQLVLDPAQVMPVATSGSGTTPQRQAREDTGS